MQKNIDFRGFMKELELEIKGITNPYIILEIRLKGFSQGEYSITRKETLKREYMIDE